MQCLVCKTFYNRQYIEDELCGFCYFTTNTRKLDSYFVEYDIIEYFREIILLKFNYSIKKCNLCKKKYPRSDKYFYKQGKYYRSKCITCYNSKKF